MMRKPIARQKIWEHEKEFRVAVSNTFGEFDVPQKQNMSFDWNLFERCYLWNQNQ